MGLGKIFKQIQFRKKYKSQKLAERNKKISGKTYLYLEKIFEVDFYEKNHEMFIEDVNLPTHVNFFKGINIKFIIANGNNSFAISQNGNNIYCWGCNKNNKFGISNENKRKIFKPHLLFSGCLTKNELYLDIDNKQDYFSVITCIIIINLFEINLLFLMLLS